MKKLLTLAVICGFGMGVALANEHETTEHTDATPTHTTAKKAPAPKAAKAPKKAAGKKAGTPATEGAHEGHM